MKKPQQNMPRALDPERSFIFRVQPRLAEYEKSYNAGIIPALFTALHLIRDSGFPTPNWVLEGAIKIVGERLTNPKSKKRGGPGANELTQYQNMMRDLRRWWLVQEVMRTEGFKKTPAFKKVSQKLKEHGELSVCESMVRTSYARVEDDKHDWKKWRYHAPGYELGKLTGTLPAREARKKAQ
jgi:hypothetical protein